MEDVVQCTSDQNLHQLAEHIDVGLLLPIKAAGEKKNHYALDLYQLIMDYQLTIRNLSRSFSEKNMINDPVVLEQLLLRKDCICRDGNMCVVSKVYNAWSRHTPPGKETSRIEAAHILPLGLCDLSEEF